MIFLPRTLVAPLFVLLAGAVLIGSIVSCGSGGGGGGGGGDADVVFAGTITRGGATTSTTTATTTDTTAGASTEATTTTTTLRGPQCPTSGEGIEVCAFNSCSTSSSDGNWSFSVDEFGGGDVDLIVVGCGVNAIARIVDLNGDARRVELTLSVVDQDTVTYSGLVQSEDPNPVDATSDVTTTTQ